MSSIFGGSKQKSQQQSTSQNYSGNQAYGTVQAATDPWIGIGNQAGSMIKNLLGLGDSQAGADAFNTYKNSTGYQTNLDEGIRAMDGSAAMRGGLDSGATRKAALKYGNTLNNSFFDKYLSSMFGAAGQGQNALSQLINAGQYSQGSSSSSGTSSGSSNNGMGSFIGSILGAAASDPLLKKNVTKIGENEDLSVYTYNYVWENDNDPLHTGYMADEVSEKYPEAVGPLIDGKFKTLYYERLPSLEN